MIYPTLHLHRSVRKTSKSEAETVDYYLQPARIIDFEGVTDGGSKISIDDGDSSGGGPCMVHVNESPDMIRQGILEAITQQAAASTKGAIQMQLAAQNELQRQQQSGIAIARGGIPPINGG